MGTRASAEATHTAPRSDPREPPSPPTLPPRPRCASRAPAPPPARAAELRGPEPPGSRYASAELDPKPAAAAEARKLTREWLARWDRDDLTEPAQIIASEIVTNAVQHIPPGSAGLAIIYAIHATPDALRITVWDIGPGQPRPVHPHADDETGRGLLLVNHLTGGNWGWRATPKSGGKVVYAVLTGRTAQDTAA
jgi:anti-sigma regulatory factor (Ser/Thr protein kinase)